MHRFQFPLIIKAALIPFTASFSFNWQQRRSRFKNLLQSYPDPIIFLSSLRWAERDIFFLGQPAAASFCDGQPTVRKEREKEKESVLFSTGVWTTQRGFDYWPPPALCSLARLTTLFSPSPSHSIVVRKWFFRERPESLRVRK